MVSKKKQINPTNAVDISLTLPTKTGFFVEKSPYIIWNRETIKSLPQKKENRFNKLYFDNRIGFNEAFNIMDSSLNNLRKDQLILDSLLRFCLSRTLSLTDKYDLFVDLPLVDPTNRIHTEPKEIIMVNFFYSFLYTYHTLNGMSHDNRIPAKVIEKYLLIYLGVHQHFKDKSINIEDQTLDILDFYLCQIDYFEYFDTRKAYLVKKEFIINEFLFLLKRLGLIESRIGSYYFITNISRYIALNYLNDTRKFSFPSLNGNDKPNLVSFSPFDVYYNEYLFFCKENSIGLEYITFSDYIKGATKVNSNSELMKYQKSTLLLYSFMDYICIRELYKNKSIYYFYNKDWNFN